MLFNIQSTRTINSGSATVLNLIVATQAEADPVISELKLKKISSSLICYQNDDVHLVITGIGKCNTATACGWLANKTIGPDTTNHRQVVWMNFGIAGHVNADIGSCFRAHKITDLATEKVWFPHPPTIDFPSSDLITVDQPLPQYRPDQLHDMEASSFVEAARKFSDAELVQSLKVVSDNSDHPLAEVNAKLATRLIADNLEQIVNFLETLKSLSNTAATAENIIAKTIKERWHFSVSQKILLDRLLQRHNVLLGPLDDIPDYLDDLKSSKEVLVWLQRTVDSADCSL